MGEAKNVQRRVIASIFLGEKSGKEEEARIVQAIKDVFMFISGAAGKKLGKAMVDEQEIVMNLADILADAFICDSAMSQSAQVGNGTCHRQGETRHSAQNAAGVSLRSC
jgi:hypothetical protein